MKKLIEVEMDGQAAVKQVNEMREGFALKNFDYDHDYAFMLMLIT